MRRIVVKKNGKTYFVTVPDYDSGAAPIVDNGPGTGSAPYFLPFISSKPPISSSVAVGQSLTLTVYGGPSGPFDYIAFQWQTGSLNLIDGAHYTGSRTNMLTIYNATSSNVGMYDVIVSNQHGLITSSYFWVSVV